jgi:hypothetical protein
LQRRQQQRNQNADDRDHNQQLHQREGSSYLRITSHDFRSVKLRMEHGPVAAAMLCECARVFRANARERTPQAKLRQGEDCGQAATVTPPKEGDALTNSPGRT